MARRPTTRAKLALETLEAREVLSAGGPTAEAQELLELTNFARQHPAEAANWAISDMQTDNLGLTLKTFGLSADQARRDIASHPAAQPLAWSPQLTQAATVQSRAQAERGVQTHDGGGTLADGTAVGVSLNDRITNAHYDQAISEGENAFAYARSARNATKAFLLDWGNDRNVLPHLTNLMNPSQREAGFGVVASGSRTLGPKLVTEVFGARAGAKAMLVGVAYNDTVVADGMYEAGEGVGDVAIDVTDASGATRTISTWDSGGYQVALDPGTYQVTARVGNKIVRSQQVQVGDKNVKVDFVLSDPWSGGNIAPPKPVETPAPAPVPVPVRTPAPAPAPAPAPVTVRSETPKPTPTPSLAPTVSPAPVEAPKPAPAPAPAPAPTPAAAPVTPKAEVASPASTFRQADPVPADTSRQQVKTVALQLVTAPDPLNSEAISWESW